MNKIRVIDQNGNNLDYIDFAKAECLAEEAGLDLVKVSEDTYKIMNLSKYKYEKKKKITNNKPQKTKEVRISQRIEDNDYKTKLNQIIKFLKNKDKCVITLKMNGREVTHKHLSMEIINKIIEDTKHIGTSNINTTSNIIQLTISPIK